MRDILGGFRSIHHIHKDVLHFFPIFIDQIDRLTFPIPRVSIPISSVNFGPQSRCGADRIRCHLEIALQVRCYRVEIVLDLL